MGVNREYKSSVFSMLFSEPEKMLELYNALTGSNIINTASIVDATLTDTLFMNRINDLAFVVQDRLVILVEHQSTINKNMALRLLLYIARVYEKILDTKAMYRDKLIKIPRPQFFVLYNGVNIFPEREKISLSNAFFDQDNIDVGGLLELEVDIINVNQGYNKDLHKKSETLSCYVIFVSKVREFLKEGLELENAITKTINYCIKNNILADFLNKHSKEVKNMLVYEFDLDTAKEVWLEEGVDKGKVSILARQLSKKFGNLISDCENLISNLSSLQLDKLANKIFDFMNYAEVVEYIDMLNKNE